MTPRIVGAILLALTLAACESGGAGDAAPETSASEGAPAAEAAPADAGTAETTPGGTGAAALPPPQPGAPDSPEAGRRIVDEDEMRDIYVALDASVTPTAVIFAIDQNRNGNPSDERAIRISPENNQCNPQELTRYDFPPGSQPVFNVEIARRGVTPAELPSFMAVSVTEAMLQGNLVSTREESLPQNVCTRKLWEILVQNQAARAAQAAGQQ